MKDAKSIPPVQRWLAAPVPRDVADSIARLAAADDVRYVAVMPDVHLAAEVCVGLAVATTRTIYPCAVGSDIGCGMAALRFGANADALADEAVAAAILAALYKHVPSLKHSARDAPNSLPEQLLASPLSHPRLEKLKQRDGRLQLGTLGRGNHFLELQRDASGGLWLMLHSGSRGMGQAITAHHLEMAASASRKRRFVGIEADSVAGQAYLQDLEWAIAYARANRLAMIEATRRILFEQCDAEAQLESLIHCDHNHVRRETHFGEPLWVHRKGALSAADGEPGIVPGSMGTRSFHVLGRGEPASLCSSSHGAGRSLSRGDAARKISAAELQRQMRGVWFDHRRTTLLRDEAPTVYKDIGAVMRAQRALTRIERELHPGLSYKG
jgi:tRNA-splicing ligase RtcB